MASRNILLAVALAIGLLVGFGASFAYSQGQITSLQNSLNHANESISMLHDEMGNMTRALPLVPHTGAMIHSGWVVIASAGSGDYVISIHAEGLEPASSGAYIVEGTQRTTSMNTVPIGADAAASEFEANSAGVGNFWTVLMQSPTTSFESIQILYLPGMNMTQASPVASVSLG